MTAHLSGTPRPPAPGPAAGRQTTVLRRALGSHNARIGAVLCLLVCLAALGAPWLAPHSPTAQDLTAGLLPPSPQHLFGTDQLGRDVFSRVLFAARTDVGIALAAALIPFVTGVSLGLVSGYVGRTTDWVISRVTDTVIAFPFYVLVIALVFAVGAGAPGIIVTFALVGWVGYARVIRALTASMRRQGWVRAARGAGLSHARILVRHLLPNVLPQAVVLLATEIVLIMVAIVTLGFLGLGVQPPTPDWGTMIADGQAFVTSHWWLSVLPGLAVIVTGVGLSLLGDGIGDALRVNASEGRQVRRADRQVGTRSRRARTVQGVAPRPPAGALRVRGLAIAASHAARRGAVAPATAPIPLLVGGPHATGLSLRVDPGQALGIVGESGSGKSLTLRAIAGLLPPGVSQVDGEIHVGGRYGMVFQDPLSALDPLTRVGTQLREACRAAGVGDPATRVRELLADVRLPETDRIMRAYPHELSGGQRQRVVIAMALAGDPAVLLADEPTTALDVTVQREVLTLLAELRRERGLTLLLVSHDLGVVANICDRIMVMRAGEVVEEGATRSLLSKPEHPYTRELLAAVPRPPARDSEGERAEQHVRPAPEPLSPVAPGSPQRSPLTLRVRDLRLRYGGREVVTGVSFDVRRSLGLVGESGSGKTSIARAIAGELPLSAGSVTLSGDLPAASRSRAAHRTAIQLIPQDPGASLNPRMRVGATLAEVVRVHWGDRDQVPSRSGVASRVAELLAEVGLESSWAHAYPHELSGGQRQRVAIARALAASPRLLIADEATSALDVSVQAAILSLLRRLRDERGVALLVISHDLSVVHALCDDVVVLRAGRVVEQGPDTLRHPAEPYTRALLASVPRLPV